MAHGTPDWGLTAGTVTTYQLTDLAELAARLGSIVTYDRRGEVFFLEDFNDTLARWDKAAFGTDAYVALSRVEARSTPFSCRLKAGGSAGGRAYIYRLAELPSLSNVGLEAAFCTDDIGQYIRLWLSVYTGSLELSGALRYTPATDTLEYRAADGSYVSLDSDLHLLSASSVFHPLKLVVDPNAGTYLRAIVGAHAYDLSAYPLSSAADSTDPSLYLEAYHYGSGTVVNSVWVDDVILTQNEPGGA
jgi:hypothetical protein